MDILLDSWSAINWWSVVVAVVSTAVIGYLWYDMKMGFGRTWARLVGLSEKDMENPEGMGQIFGVMYFVAFLTAVCIALAMDAMGVSTTAEIVTFAVVFGGIFRAGAHFIHNGFARRDMNLTLIDAGHDFVSFLVMSLIIGLWG